MLRFSKLVRIIPIALLTVSCTKKPEDTVGKHYQLSGVVIALDSKNQTATIKHGAIAGWMEAMTMEYPIKSRQEFDQLHTGEQIIARVNVHGMDYDLTSVHEQSAPK
jgi:Cu/Ag efflux protein CusF